MSGIAWNPDDTTADEKVCQYWASRTSVETDRVHTMQWYGPKGSPVWIGQCSSCGWVDGNELAERIAELVGRPLQEWPLVSRDNRIEQLRTELAQVRGDHERMVAVHTDAYRELSTANTKLRTELERTSAAHAVVTSALDKSGEYGRWAQREIARRQAELELLRPVIEAARAWRAWWGTAHLDGYGSMFIPENSLADAVDALGAAGRSTPDDDISAPEVGRLTQSDLDTMAYLGGGGIKSKDVSVTLDDEEACASCGGTRWVDDPHCAACGCPQSSHQEQPTAGPLRHCLGKLGSCECDHFAYAAARAGQAGQEVAE